MELDTEELEATKNREKTADELFAELGYKKTRDGIDCWCNYENNRKNIHFEIGMGQSLFISYKDDDFNEGGVIISKKELEAINKKVEELRMEVENIIKIDKNLILERQAKCKEDIKYYEHKYRYAKENNDGFYMKFHWRTINRLQAELKTLIWILSCEIKEENN